MDQPLISDMDIYVT